MSVSGGTRNWALAAAVCGAAAIAAPFVPQLPAIAGTVAAAASAVAALVAAWLGSRLARRNHALQLQSEELQLQCQQLRQAEVSHSKLEQQLLQAKQAAEAATLAKGEFLATMSHEIRTPLNGILPMLELVAQGPLEMEQRNMLSTATESSRQLFRIVDDILDYSKLEANRLELEVTTFNLRETLDGMVLLMQRTAEHKGLHISLHIDPAVRLSVRGDPVRLRQVLGNLLVNAIKFTAHGSIQVRVKRLGETPAQHQLRFEVRDTGIGLDASQRERLFESFTQADASTTRLYGGTGLGLAICKRIVDLMHGSIGVQSQPGRGSTFWFEIPLLKVIGDLQRPEHLRNARQVLLVTPEPRLRQRLELVLPTWGYQPRVAYNLQEALERLRNPALSGRWHAVIADLGPLRHGAAALQRAINRSEPHVPRLLWLYGDASVPDELRDNATLLPRQLPDSELRRALADTEPTAPPPAPIQMQIQAPLQASPARAKRAVTEATTDSDLTGMLVLVVEDNPVNLLVAQKLLQTTGCRTEPAENGAIALEKMHQRRYDAVLMDCQMPVLDGYAATQRWRQHEADSGAPHLPIIAMTANAMAGDRQRCLDAGMDEYLSKPISRSQLQACLQTFKPAPPVSPTVVPMNTPHDPAHATAGAPAPLTAPTLERGVLDELVEIAGDDTHMIIKLYLDETPILLQQLQAAVAIGNLPRMGEVAHSLKSSSANVGALAMSEAAKQLEHAVRSGTLEQPESAAAQVVAEFSRARQALLGYQADMRGEQLPQG